MADRINPKLLAALLERTGLSRAQMYARIQKAGGSLLLPANLAAIKVAADEGISINRFASSDELVQLRSAGSPVAPPQQQPLRRATVGKSGSARKKQKKRATENTVFVIHGRDEPARKSMFDFLRAVGIKPIEWHQALALSGKPSPYVGEILAAAFAKARAVVALLTPDDLALLRDDLRRNSDKAYEKKLTGQARANVLFEAGMAFGTHPDQTVLVEIGTLREFSDIGGRHTVKMDDSADRRKELCIKLRNAGCDVDESGTDWMTAGSFVSLVRSPRKKMAKKKAPK